LRWMKRRVNAGQRDQLAQQSLRFAHEFPAGVRAEDRQRENVIDARNEPHRCKLQLPTESVEESEKNPLKSTAAWPAILML
jgi:hypothetical protein